MVILTWVREVRTWVTKALTSFAKSPRPQAKARTSRRVARTEDGPGADGISPSPTGFTLSGPLGRGMPCPIPPTATYD